MRERVTRRGLLAAGAAAGAGVLVSPAKAQIGASTRPAPMTLALNTSTIRPASLEEKIRAASEAGYDGIELWIDEIEAVDRGGGSLEDLRARLEDLGLFVPNVIGLWDAMPPDEADWPAQFEVSKRRMDLCARVGARHVAAIPAPDRPDIDVLWAAERYRRLLDAGREVGVTVAIEFVGFLQGVHTLGQATAIALESGAPDACMVADTFHLYRGGSMFEGMRHLQGSFLAVCHFNDAPADPPRTEQGDEHRVYPGDGVLPLVEFVRTLIGIGFTGPLSLEMFKRSEWERDPGEVARIGIDKMRAIVAEAQATA